MGIWSGLSRQVLAKRVWRREQPEKRGKGETAQSLEGPRPSVVKGMDPIQGAQGALLLSPSSSRLAEANERGFLNDSSTPSFLRFLNESVGRLMVVNFKDSRPIKILDSRLLGTLKTRDSRFMGTVKTQDLSRLEIQDFWEL
ncbi:hypothetical protein WH47_07750 [Habropoda laboriosa]|uniref:Uncharacterized protein n=1 Tax=Habropoda laboriosa TaxID=597456 RepID=A0A0L7QNH4_9HYME|nr:hypothetical protein WH47_07750 [Habropoda laboriosa]